MEMKRMISLLMCLCMAFSLFGCGDNTVDAPGETQKVWKPTPYDNIVADPQTWHEEFTALPVANDSMTTDELRRLCVDYFRLQLSFRWTPNENISFINASNRQNELPVGMAYSGMFYKNNDGSGGGNLYKVVNFYNPETGVLDVAHMKDVYNILASHCSWGAMMAWARVCNTARMNHMNEYIPSCGALPVGPYTYNEYQYNYDEYDATTKIIQKNGEQIMYQSYANMLPGDGLYSSSVYHIEMCSIAPVVVKNADGTINGEESYLHFCDQNANGTNGWIDLEKQADGTPLRTLGGVDTKVNFKKMLEDGYSPFTLAELQGTDPVEEGKAWVGGLNSGYANGKEIAVGVLFQTNVCANYVIANVKVTVKSPDGKVLNSYIPEIHTTHTIAPVALSDGYDADKLLPFADGKNLINISVQLATGAWVEAFETTLTQ